MGKVHHVNGLFIKVNLSVFFKMPYGAFVGIIFVLLVVCHAQIKPPRYDTYAMNFVESKLVDNSVTDRAPGKLVIDKIGKRVSYILFQNGIVNVQQLIVNNIGYFASMDIAKQKYYCISAPVTNITNELEHVDLLGNIASRVQFAGFSAVQNINDDPVTANFYNNVTLSTPNARYAYFTDYESNAPIMFMDYVLNSASGSITKSTTFQVTKFTTSITEGDFALFGFVDSSQCSKRSEALSFDAFL